MNNLRSNYPTSVNYLLDLLDDSVNLCQDEWWNSITPEEMLKVMGLARHHMVSSFIYQRIHKIEIKNLNKWDLEKSLQQDYYAAIIQNTRLFNTLTALLKLFTEREIPVIVLKGAYLAEKVYENIALRTMGDIDLLVPRQKLLVAYQVAMGLGYQPAHKFDFDEEIIHSHSLPPLIAPGKPQIDLHWSLFPPNLPFNYNEEAIWVQSKQDTLSGENITSIRPEHLLLHLCFHFAYMHRHGGQLYHICDITEVLKKHQSTLDWEFIHKEAHNWGTVKSTFLALETARQLINAPISADSLSLLQPPDYKPEYISWLVDQMLDSQVFSVNMASLWVTNSFKERVIHFFRGIFWAPRIIREKYPQFSSGFGLPLAYILRILDVARRQIPRMWKLIRKDRITQDAARQLRDIELLGRWMEIN